MGDIHRVRFRRNRISRPLVLVAAGLGTVVVAAFAYQLLTGTAPFESRPAPLPQIIRGASDGAISPSEISVVDGDTIKTRGRTIRLVGFDTAEVGLLARCARERELADRARARLKGLIRGGDLKLRLVPCACLPGTEGTRQCNYGRACGVLTAQGRDVGATMIQEGIARPYICAATSCPPRQSWC